jgi:hypothetical protein
MSPIPTTTSPTWHRLGARSIASGVVDAPGEPVPPLLVSMMEVLVAAATTPLEELSMGADWDLCAAMLTLHAITDEACAGLGVAPYLEVWPSVRAHGDTKTRKSRRTALGDIAQLVGHSGTTVTELVYRHQIRPVIQTGATVMDRLFGHGGSRA